MSIKNVHYNVTDNGKVMKSKLRRADPKSRCIGARAGRYHSRHPWKWESDIRHDRIEADWLKASMELYSEYVGREN
jgi:hypothetical protein